MARPRTGVTPARPFRVPKDEYDAALAEARRRGESLTAAVRRFLRAYGRGEDPTAPE